MDNASDMEIALKSLGIDVGRSGVKLAHRAPGAELRRTRIPKFMEYIDWEDDTAIVERIRGWVEHEQLDLAGDARVVIGATGAVEFERTFSAAGLQVQLLGDVTVAALSCGIREDGLLMICGTGAALVRFSRGGKRIMKAYGPMVGDRWGGLSLGRAAIRYVLDQWALKREAGPLEAALAEHLKISNRREYVHWLQTTENHYGELGELGGITVTMAGEGNEPARALCRQMIDEMTAGVREALSLGEQQTPVSLGLQGGMIEGSAWLRSELTAYLSHRNMKVEIRVPSDPLDVMALREAEAMAGESPER